MAESRFSVITVTLNNMDGLRKTAESLKAQLYRNFEWIVIDGGSNDGSLEYLDLSKPDILISEQDYGIYDAMNKGLIRASGVYALFLNAGDVLAAPDVLEKIAVMEADFIYGDAFEDGYYKRAKPHNCALYGLFTHHQAMVYRAALLKDLRYNLSYKIAADYDLTLRFLAGAGRVMRLDYPVCIFDTGGVSQSLAGLGRREQFTIRGKNGLCNPLTNGAIYMAQTVNWHLRKFMPDLYWRLKRLRR